MFKNKKTRFIFFDRGGESFGGEPDLSQVQSESADIEEKPDLDNPDSPENHKYSKQFQAKFGDRLNVSYSRQGVEYSYQFVVDPDGKRLTITRTNESEKREEGKTTPTVRRSTFASLYEGKIFGMPEIGKVLDSAAQEEQKESEKPFENAEQVKEALRTGAEEIMDKYKRMNSVTFIKKYPNKNAFFNAVYDELVPLIVKVAERAHDGKKLFVALVKINGFELGVPGPSMGDGYGSRKTMLDRTADEWVTRLYNEKEQSALFQGRWSDLYSPAERKEFMSSIRRVNNYLNGPGLKYLYRNIMNGKLANLRLFKSGIDKLMEKATAKLPRRNRDAEMWLHVTLSQTPIQLRFQEDGSYTWAYKADELAKQLLYSREERRTKLGKALKLRQA
jgi:hypothetical protein